MFWGCVEKGCKSPSEGTYLDELKLRPTGRYNAHNCIIRVYTESRADKTTDRQ